MNRDDMNCISQSAKHIKRLVCADIAENKATGVRGVLRICFYNFSAKDNLFNFRQRYTAAIAAPLTVSADLIFTGNEFLSDLFNHTNKYYHTSGLCQGLINS
ncbi:MAG: hypothetical protein A2471_03035 [Omnitrophica WOR_2 bacterium RIFOXYC2_FULL_45_15]|nr:MAG: hypothetical protein A2471_03035 [Omnitrophica WOR_2 bacterium RIFOXYC2_FULL_45_15]